MTTLENVEVILRPGYFHAKNRIGKNLHLTAAAAVRCRFLYTSCKAPLFEKLLQVLLRRGDRGKAEAIYLKTLTSFNQVYFRPWKWSRPATE